MDRPYWTRKREKLYRWIGEYLEVVTDFDDSTFLVEALAESSSRRPKEAAECFLRIIQKMSQKSFVYVRENEAKEILRAALASDDPEVEELGKRAQDLLLRLGRFEFKTVGS